MKIHNFLTDGVKNLKYNFFLNKVYVFWPIGVHVSFKVLNMMDQVLFWAL
jgi:hypothetical protein